MERFKIFGYANLAGKRELLEASKNQLIDLNEFTKINHIELLAAPRAALTKDYTQNLIFNRNISIDLDKTWYVYTGTKWGEVN